MSEKRKRDEESEDGGEKKQKTESGEKPESVHFEIPVADFARAKKFYGDAFKFTFMDWKDSYVMYQCPNPKTLAGGLIKYEGEWPEKPLSVMYLHCDDIGKKFDEVFAAGGLIYQNKKAIDPDNLSHGSCAIFQDTEGGFMGLYQRGGGKDTEVKTIKQTVNFKLKPADIYAKFTDAKKHAEFSGEPAEISTEVRGLSSLFGGKILARNIELDGKSLIVQCWRSVDWPAGHFSKLTIQLKSKRGTELTLTQENVPADKADDIAEGWYKFYWNKFGEGDKHKKE
jgi:predicted enzyme related to lactoylglutathione lyase